MCKYCENNEHGYTEYIYENYDETVQIIKSINDKHKLDIDVMSEYGGYININFPIDFCPKCIRKL